MNTLNHLAIIMDGNGRWAKQNKLPRTAGHYKGVEVLRNITIYANRLGIKCLTVYAFSTENWKRSADEVNYIMSLPKIIDDAINTTRNNTGLILNFAFNYGARDEIVRAAKAYAKDYKDGKVSDLDEEGFASYLYTKDLPEVDLLIRTGSEMRLSNFLLYQLAYSEFVVIDTLWPDFNNEVLDSCIKEYQSRKRNFGGRDETKSN